MNLDANRDGVFTISDVWIWAEFIGCWPGNFILKALARTSVGRFLELSPWAEYTTAAWVISIAVWLIVIAALSIASSR